MRVCVLLFPKSGNLGAELLKSSLMLEPTFDNATAAVADPSSEAALSAVGSKGM